MKPEASRVCVQCAESVQGLSFAAQIFPCEGVVVETKWAGPLKLRSNLMGRVSYGDTVFTVTRLDGGSISFKRIGEEKEHRADNIFAAWSMMCKEIRTPTLSMKEIPKGVRGSGHRAYDWGQD